MGSRLVQHQVPGLHVDQVHLAGRQAGRQAGRTRTHARTLVTGTSHASHASPQGARERGREAVYVCLPGYSWLSLAVSGAITHALTYLPRHVVLDLQRPGFVQIVVYVKDHRDHVRVGAARIAYHTVVMVRFTSCDCVRWYQVTVSCESSPAQPSPARGGPGRAVWAECVCVRYRSVCEESVEPLA